MQPTFPLLSFALVDGRPVFMDVGHDSYFALDRQRESEFLDWFSAKRQEAMTSELREALGITDQTALVEAQRICAQRSLRDDPTTGRTASVSDTARIAMAVFRARRRLRAAPMVATLASISAKGAAPCDRAHAAVADRAARFTSARRLIPVRPQCLVDCLALIDWLGPLRSNVKLVFGVKLDPFAAHCWLQEGPLLLNDRVDEVARFTPVRVVDCACASR